LKDEAGSVIVREREMEIAKKFARSTATSRSSKFAVDQSSASGVSLRTMFTVDVLNQETVKPPVAQQIETVRKWWKTISNGEHEVPISKVSVFFVQKNVA
jgi:hypothetical protein